MRIPRWAHAVRCAALCSSVALWASMALLAQPADPRVAFFDALGRFTLLLDGTYGDEARYLSSALDAMAAALSRWDAVVVNSERGMAAEIGGAGPKLAARMHVALAGVYMDRGRVSDSLAQLAQARKADPAHADAPLLQALALQLTGNPTAALDALRAAHDLDPNDVTRTYLLARRLLVSEPQAGRAMLPRIRRSAGQRAAATGANPTPPALIRLDMVAERPGSEPFFPPVSYTDGFMSLQRGELSQAIVQLRESLSRDPLTGIGREDAVARAAAAFRNGKVEDARTQLQSFIAQSPRVAEAHRLLGMVALVDGDEARGIAGLEAAIGLEPGDERTRAALANTLLDAGRLDEAEQALRDALQLLPRSGRLHYLLGLTYQRQGNREGAVGELEASLSSRPLLGANTIYRMIGTLYRDEQDFERAAGALSARVDLVPADAGAHRELGNVYYLQGDDDAARAEFEIALLVDPADVDARTLLAQVQLRQGRLAEARDESRQVLELDPSHREARYVHATSLIRLGRRDEGLAEMQTFQRLQAEDAEARARAFELGRLRREAAISRASGDYDTAVALLRRALVLDPRAPASHLDLGVALLEAGQAAEAIERLTTAASLNAHFEVHRHLADAHAALGQKEDSDRERAHYERLRRESTGGAGGPR